MVSRERRRRFAADAAVPVETRSKQTVRLHKEVSEDSGETRLYCYSEERAKKERGIVERFAKRFEKELAPLDEGLSRPRTRKRLEHVWRRIGRLSENSRGVAQHYDIRVAADAAGEKAVAVTWTRRAVEGSMATHPGVYCLRSSEADWDEETLWRTYVTLTDLEAVFRSLKSELGLRPIHHHKPLRAEGHLFITVVAYQLVQIVRKRLRERGERTPVGPRCAASSPDSSASPPRSGAPTGARCTCARRPAQNPGNWPSTRPSASTPAPEASKRPSSESSAKRLARICSATRDFQSTQPVDLYRFTQNLDKHGLAGR